MQRIAPDGQKVFEKGARVQGCYAILGDQNYLSENPADPILISTGFATSASLFTAIKQPVVIAFNDANLRDVALEIKNQFPSRTIIILGDDDRHSALKDLPNSGRQKALDAVRAVEGKALFPQF